MDEPRVLRPDGVASPPAPVLEGSAARSSAPPARPDKERTAPDGPVVVVAGFWRRAAAGIVDAIVVVPAAILLSLAAGRIAGVKWPSARRAGVDYWLDLALAGEPALWGAIGLVAAIVLLHLWVFQVTIAQTPGMRLLRLRLIDVYGEAPSLWRAGARTIGYVVGAATLGLGFLWIGFDREKRGLHDWIAGTYVIREDVAE